MSAFRVAASVPLLLVLSGVAGAVTGQHAHIERIADLLVDTDGDFLADRIGEAASARGVVTASPYPARRGRELRIYLQDVSAGIRCIATERALLTGIEPGDRVVVDGTIGHYRGMEQLHLRSIERTDEGRIPEPLATDVGSLRTERLLGRLVTVTAKLSPPVLSAAAMLEDETGTVELYLPGRFLDDPDMIRKLTRGGTYQVVGYSEQNDSTEPYDAGYRLRLRSPQDLVPIPPFPYSTIASVAAILMLFSHGCHNYSPIYGYT